MYPDMLPELLEAVHLSYEDYPEVEADCLLYLASLRNNLTRTNRLANYSESVLEGMGRCPYCGEYLSSKTTEEVHDELEDKPVEKITEKFCPNCGLY